MNNTLPGKPDVLRELFKPLKPVIGMIHLRPLPGSPRYEADSLPEVRECALRDASALQAGGVDGFMVENAWDLPFLKPDEIGHETVASMAVLVRELAERFDLPIGVNCLANSVQSAIAIAQAGGASFVRANEWANAYIANEGLIESPAARALRYRSALKADNIRIFADAHVKHGAHAIVADRSLADLVQDVEFFDADAVIASGSRLGDETPLEDAQLIKGATHLPVLIGSGLTASNVAKLFAVADGAIIGTSIKEGAVWWGAVDAERVRGVMEAVRRVRGA